MSETVSSAFIASRLLAARERSEAGLVYGCVSERRAGDIARLLSAMAADVPSCFVPGWDCLPYDRASPSAEIMGVRTAALQLLASGSDRPLVIASPEGLLRRVPPRSVVQAAVIRLGVGEGIDAAATAERLQRLGYRVDDRVDEPGEYAVRGEVIDVFGAAHRQPHRIEMKADRIASIRAFDPLTQRSTDDVAQLALEPASEVVFIGVEGEAPQRRPGLEHALSTYYPSLETVFDYAAGAQLVLEAEVGERMEALLAQAAAAHAERLRFASASADPNEISPSTPERLFLTSDAWRELEACATTLSLDGYEAAPRFALEGRPGAAMTRFVREQVEAGRRVLLGAVGGRDRARLVAAAERGTDGKAAAAATLDDAAQAQPGALFTLALDAEAGFVDAPSGLVLITASDLLGSRAQTSAAAAVQTPWSATDEDLTVGDVVIHTDHGLGVLRGLETVESAALDARESLRIDYAKDTRLLAPVEELNRVWRYGSEATWVTLDRLDTDAWIKRRETIEGAVAHTARDMVALAQARSEAVAPRLEAPARAYERFVSGFPFALTTDQQGAIDAVLADLAAGRPMDRLVVGDVGFGKTEVALRAAAAAVLAGKQVAIAAPTTVLVRQHVETFRRRFETIGVAVGHLSRLVGAAEAKQTRDALESGEMRVVIGTHALTGKGVAFADLGLLIVDEEHRFGAADKAKLKALGEGVHSLALSATPIPRTLQSALVGLQDLSVIATPPARRRPIRTFSQAFDPATLRTALTRETGRGGQSFVVVPRIDDMEQMRERLATLVPELTVVAAHGKMPAAEVDEVIVGFAEGRGDVLLATNIIESGLDVPRANTMLICDADRFGLAQLHQLRGRVGRGRTQGVCYLLTDPERPVAEATLSRLGTLAAFDRLGAGMAISARDLDLRGAGEIMGEAQAGHVNLVGLGLYQHLLELAIRTARGEAVEDWTPEIKLASAGALPAEYVPEERVRLNLYARLARITEPDAVDALSDEIEDRFGPPPETTTALLSIARLRGLCRRWGVARVDAGPQAMAYTFRPRAPALSAVAALVDSRSELAFKGDRLIQSQATETDVERLHLALDLLGSLD